MLSNPPITVIAARDFLLRDQENLNFKKSIMPEIGFILMTHRNPPQAARLVRTLNLLFDHPPIVCHHDFSKCDIVPENFPANVTFVRPSLVTSWAAISVVRATVRALEIFFAAADAPKWAVLLSGADYPIKPAKVILDDLNRGGYDAHVQSLLVNRATRKKSPWFADCYGRYCRSAFVIPSLDRRFRFRNRVVRLRIPFYSRRTLPFSDHFQCYAGKQWFSVNRRAAQTMIDCFNSRSDLVEHYSRVWFSEESIFQTALSNDSALRINPIDWRFAQFPVGKPNPRILGMADLPELFASSDHFARKFEPEVDNAVLDALDRRLLGELPGG